MTGSYTLSFGGVSVGSFDASTTAAQLQAAIAALAAVGAGNVTVTLVSGVFRIDLGANLYLSNDAHFATTGSATADIDSASLKLNSPWSVTPNGPDPGQKAQFEITLYSSVQVPNVRVKIYTQGTPAVVVDETNNGTSVAELPLSELGNAAAVANATDTIRVRLSSNPGAGGAVVSLVNANGQITSRTRPARRRSTRVLAQTLSLHLGELERVPDADRLGAHRRRRRELPQGRPAGRRDRLPPVHDGGRRRRHELAGRPRHRDERLDDGRRVAVAFRGLRVRLSGQRQLHADADAGPDRGRCHDHRHGPADADIRLFQCFIIPPGHHQCPDCQNS